MTIPDHYSTLGVLPEAEGIVISAAYRALAQRYHPDKFPGDPVEAHKRMSAINEAYRILGNEKLRAEYDAIRGKDNHADYQSAENEESEDAFADALCELESRWLVATEIFPDLQPIRDSLSKISKSLAFSFVTLLLHSKRYKERVDIANTLERRFLERYFGTDAEVVAYAKSLIATGHRDAARTLNNLVDVMGSDVDHALLLRKVEKQYRIQAAKLNNEYLLQLVAKVREFGYFDDATQLAKSMGYIIDEHSTGFFGSKLEVTVTAPQGTTTKFQSGLEFIRWVKTSFC
jgi:curved DNA-binding protein CbpA